MTKETAKKKISEYYDSVWCMEDPFISIDDANHVIDEVFDDIESRTCKNCTGRTPVGVCMKKDSIGYDQYVSDNETCSKFERVTKQGKESEDGKFF